MIFVHVYGISMNCAEQPANSMRASSRFRVFIKYLVNCVLRKWISAHYLIQANPPPGINTNRIWRLYCAALTMSEERWDSKKIRQERSPHLVAHYRYVVPEQSSRVFRKEVSCTIPRQWPTSRVLAWHGVSCDVPRPRRFTAPGIVT